MAFGHLRRSVPSGSVLTLCLMAAFADGEKHEREREQIRKIAESFRPSEVDLSALYQEVLLRKPEPTALAARLSTPGARQLARVNNVTTSFAE